MRSTTWTSGRTALVHAGASGVGTASIQIARAFGASIIVTASTDKVDRCRQLGADLVVDYRTDDFVVAVREHTGGSGVDVVLDVIGGDYINRNIACVATDGRIVQVGVMESGQAQVNIGALLPKRASIIGTTVKPSPASTRLTAVSTC